MTAPTTRIALTLAFVVLAGWGAALLGAVRADLTRVDAAFQTARQDGRSGPADRAVTLQGTSWQLVKFQGGDGRTLTPDDPAKYTIQFAADGRLAARVDCNRGSGTWKATPPQLEFGPLALTRAMCPKGSLHDQIVKQWTFVRSFVVKDGRLFLSLMADGGIYEFAPVDPAR